MKPKINIPKLRFKGFEGEWKEERLDAVSNLSRGRFSPRPRNDPKYYGGGIPFVQTGDVVKSNGVVKSYSQTLNKLGLSVSKLFPKGTILITIAANIGYTGILNIDMACPDSLIGIECKDNSNNSFLNYYLTTQQLEIDRVASEAAQKNINIDFLKPYKVSLPILAEQQKIAEFLTKVDEWIENLKNQKENLEKYKKGIMQKIFAQKIRFKDEGGREFEGCEKERLGEICNITTGKLDANAMKIDGIYRFYTCAKDYFMIDKFAFDTEALLVSGNGANVGYIHYYNGKFNAYQRTYVLDKFTENILFIKYFLEENLEIRINNEKKEGNTPYIVLNTLSDMIINCPDKKEQDKIVGFLTSIDELIDSKQKQIAKAEEWKKGLMQGLFV